MEEIGLSSKGKVIRVMVIVGALTLIIFGVILIVEEVSRASFHLFGLGLILLGISLSKNALFVSYEYNKDIQNPWYARILFLCGGSIMLIASIYFSNMIRI